MDNSVYKCNNNVYKFSCSDDLFLLVSGVVDGSLMLN